MSANRSAPPALQHGVRTPTAHNARATPPSRLRAIPHNTDRAQRGNRRRKDRGTKPDRQASQILDDGRSNLMRFTSCLRGNNPGPLMSALGQKQTFGNVWRMSAITPNADIVRHVVMYAMCQKELFSQGKKCEMVRATAASFNRGRV